MATKSEYEIGKAFDVIYERLGMTKYDPCLKGKYLVPSALRVKTIKRTKAGNSGSMTKAQKRMPRLPAPLSCKGSQGFKPWMEPIRHPWKKEYAERYAEAMRLKEHRLSRFANIDLSEAA